jgi:hypothetical protein
MEQHNIDSRFKQGLENLNRQPSADAWARLQARMNEPQETQEPVIMAPEEKKEEKRILMWLHYAAAAVVLLFISIGILRNGSQFSGKTEMPVAVNKASEKTTPEVKAPEISAPVSEKDTAPETLIASAEIPVNAAESVKTGSENNIKNAVKNGSKTDLKTTFAETPETQIAQVSKKVKTEKNTEKTSAPKSFKVDQKEQKPEEVMIASSQTNNESNAKASEAKPALLAGMAIEVIVKKDNSENAVAVNNSNPEEGKDSKLKSILKQAKNLKNGESVDLQAIGLSADSKLAMGTRNITQKFSKVLDI